MPVQAGAIAFIDDCNGKYQFMAKVLAKEPPVKGRKKRDSWEKAALLWGDVVFVRKIAGSKAQVSAKGHILEVPKARLTDKPILNIWQIDVGQGDASLIRFPDGKWAAIDLGPARSGFINTNSGRTAVDFMAWMAFEDHVWLFQGEGDASKTFHLDWIVFTHPDDDHVGAGKQFVDMLGKYWSVGTVYHNGMGRFDGTARQWTSSTPGAQSFAGHSEEELFAPLLYSTELSRSVAMRTGYKAFTRASGATGSHVHTEVGDCWLATGATGPFVRLADMRVIENLTYGLINIRTDGKTVAIAVLEESAKNPAFHVETFRPSELQAI